MYLQYICVQMHVVCSVSHPPTLFTSICICTQYPAPPPPPPPPPWLNKTLRLVSSECFNNKHLTRAIDMFNEQVTFSETIHLSASSLSPESRLLQKLDGFQLQQLIERSSHAYKAQLAYLFGGFFHNAQFLVQVKAVAGLSTHMYSVLIIMKN